MRSQLTRHVFRQIIRNEPIYHKHCVGAALGRRSWINLKTRDLPRTASRSFFGFSRKTPRESKEPDFDPGFESLVELSNKLSMEVRLPSTSDISKALKQFFTSKKKRGKALEELQATYAIEAFRYVHSDAGRKEGSSLSYADLQVALEALIASQSHDQHEQRVLLAETVFSEISRLRDEGLGREDVREYIANILFPYILILTQCGKTTQARTIVTEFWKTFEEKDNHGLWHQLLRGFAKERNEEEIEQTIEVMRQSGVLFDSKAHHSIFMSFRDHNDFALTKKWYLYPIDGGRPVRHRTDLDMVKMCIVHKEFDFGQPIVTKLLSGEPTKQVWDLTFQWAAARGKGVDEIERMMNVMVRTNEENGSDARPDIDTINSLIELANSVNDPYTAERYFALGQKWQISPDAQTYLLQFDYRLKVKDLDGARHVYKQLQAYEVPDNRDIPLINNLILALCRVDPPNHTVIMSYVEDLTERSAGFSPQVVSALSLLHLSRDELHDVIDLLQTHAYHYEFSDRALIRDALAGYVFDRSNSTARVWDAYTVMRHVFTETEIPTRLRLMNEFFERGRPDMATHVFGHMRQFPMLERRPDTAAYAMCLEGIAQLADETSLETVHNMLRLDSNVEPDTKLRNALMLAYSACKMSDRALEIWDDILYSREGPTYNSIRIALRACETVSWGDKTARDIWARLKRFDIEVGKDIYASYMAALAGQGLLREARQLLEGMEAEIGSKPDAMT